MRFYKNRLGVLAVLFSFHIMSLFAQTEQADALQSYRRGRELEAQNRATEAAVHYDEAVKICLAEISQNASSMDSYTVLTWTLQRQGRYAEVLEWGERGLRINERDFRIIETMGEAYFYLGDFNRSLRYMQRYVENTAYTDRVSIAYFFIGEIYRLERKYLRADIAYTTAVWLEPGSALWWYRLGTVRESAGDYQPAIDAYERALRLNPGYSQAAAALARARELRG